MSALKFHKKLVVCLFFVFFAACGGHGGSGNASVFSAWASDETGAVIDFSAGQLRTPVLMWVATVSGEQCYISLMFAGTEREGRMAISDGSGSCAQFNGRVDSYSISGNTMTTCPVNYVDSTGSCHTYHVMSSRSVNLLGVVHNPARPVTG